MRRVLGVVVARVKALAFGWGGGRAQQAGEQTPPPLPEPPTNRPWRVVSTKLQARRDQLLIQVVVPDDTTVVQIREWTAEVRELYCGQAEALFINWHEGFYDEDEVGTMLGTMLLHYGSTGEPVWMPVHREPGAEETEPDGEAIRHDMNDDSAMETERGTGEPDKM